MLVPGKRKCCELFPYIQDSYNKTVLLRIPSNISIRMNSFNRISIGFSFVHYDNLMTIMITIHISTDILNFIFDLTVLFVKDCQFLYFPQFFCNYSERFWISLINSEWDILFIRKHLTIHLLHIWLHVILLKSLTNIKERSQTFVHYWILRH